MSEFKGLPQELGLHSAPENPVIVREEDDRPQPRMDRNASGGMAATVGRLRKDVNILINLLLFGLSSP